MNQRKHLQRRMEYAENCRRLAMGVAWMTSDWATLRVLATRYCRAARVVDLTAQGILAQRRGSDFSRIDRSLSARFDG